MDVSTVCLDLTLNAPTTGDERLSSIVVGLFRYRPVLVADVSWFFAVLT